MNEQDFFWPPQSTNTTVSVGILCTANQTSSGTRRRGKKILNDLITKDVNLIRYERN